MSKLNRFVVMFTVVCLAVVSGVLFVNAQDATATPAASTSTTGMIQCDADLIQNLYVAQHFFGFDQIGSQMMANGATASSMVDLNTIDKGQFTPWFNAPMTGAGPWTTDQLNTVAGMMAMDDATLHSTMMAGQDSSTLTNLSPVTVAGEDPACTQLRTELARFWGILSFENFTGAITMPSAGASGTGTTGTGVTAPIAPVPEATAASNG